MLARALPLLVIALGLGILIRTIALGGGEVGIVVGALLVVAGWLRLYLSKLNG